MSFRPSALRFPARAWLLLVLVPLTALAAHQLMAAGFSQAADDRGRISLLRDASGAAQFETYAVSRVVNEPATGSVQSPVISRIGAHVTSVVSDLRKTAGQSGAISARLARLARDNAGYQMDASGLLSRAAVAPSASVRTLYARQTWPSYHRLRDDLSVALAAETRAAAAADASARLVGWLGYGIATVVIVLVLLWFALLARRLEHRSGQAALEDTRRQLQAILDGSTAAMFVADREGRYVLTNRAFDAGLGLDYGAAVGERREDVMPAEVLADLDDEHRRVLAGETIAAEHLFAHGDESRRVSVVKFPLTDTDGDVYAVCGIVSDISDVRQMESQIAQLSDHDPLTGLFNRKRLMSELETHLRYATRHHTSGALVLLDIDNFKLVNDSRGHASGDRQLTAVARVLRDRMRETDTIARLGSDEFAIVLAEVSEQQALLVASSIQALTGGPPGSPRTRAQELASGRRGRKPDPQSKGDAASP